MGTYETLNEVLVKLFRDINDLEQKAIINQEFGNLTKNMSSIAKELSVTVGTLTISMNSLVKKGYVVRQRGSEDRRVVYISLSEQGRKAYEHHKKFHEQMINGVVEELTKEELEALVKALKKLNSWFRSFEEH